ncbi:MAG: hypothetical protein OEY14_10075, partial [Myxococcales bacterium]|nr:hypothetical protein [Myxococcales bacterium]
MTTTEQRVWRRHLHEQALQKLQRRLTRAGSALANPGIDRALIPEPLPPWAWLSAYGPSAADAI